MRHPQNVDGDEAIARFITDKKYYRPSDRTVRPNAFMPASDNELSVYRVSGIVLAEILRIGIDYVARPRAKPLLGYAEVRASEFTVLGLNFVTTEVPHPRHANVVGWPERVACRSKAQILAESARLHLAD